MPTARKLTSAIGAWLGRLLLRSEGLLAATFALLIVIGTVLLWLPVSHENDAVGLLEAFFTSTSAVCVTGLTVVDTGTAYTPFGQAVILVLIQLGGLGIMTFAALAAQLIGGKLSFRSQAIISDTFYQTSAAANLRRDLKRIVGLTLGLEAVGAALLYLDFRQLGQNTTPVFSSVFHAVSAFCNAGFSLHADSLTAVRAYPLTMLTIMSLIVLGGLGHTVVLEIGRRGLDGIRRRRTGAVRWSLHSRIVLTMSAGLIAAGAIAILVLGIPDGHESWPVRCVQALFQSITARTAGFNTLNIAALPLASLLVLTSLMFIGGSPGSCAGGIKTTSLAVRFAEVRARTRGRQDTTLWGRRLAPGVADRAAAVIGLAVAWNLAGWLILAATDGGSHAVAFKDLMFEQVSAFATVGLSTGITAGLSVTGKLWLIASMLVGRLGPLTAAMAAMPLLPTPFRYPEERLMIG